jgi:hypothetical protein
MTSAILKNVWGTNVQEGGTRLGGIEVGARNGMSGKSNRAYIFRPLELH